MPGCMTIQEIQTALELGVDIVKLFPGNLYSPSMIKAIKGPLPQANIMPTGGVSLSNLAEWIQAGAVAVGIGSDLTSDAVKTGDFSLVAKKAAQYIEAYKAAKK
jgi:2-dehydro-3-deoxyphosphogluconate aldolase/(4S)-4-hydroxy-2-oxoglutarate aldolase